MTPEDLIRQYVHIPLRSNGAGWYQLNCKVCNDHGRKGPRAAFRFEDAGNTVGYHCFNCGHAATFSLETSKLPSRAFRQVLTAFNVPVDQFKLWSLERMSKGTVTAETYEARKIRKSRQPKVIQPMSAFYELTDDPDDDLAQVAIDYLTSRGIDWRDQVYYLSAPTGGVTDRWYGRLIIPVYKQGQMIFYSGRDLTDSFPRKYIHASVERQAVLYGFDNILDHERTDPLLIFEGWFDAASVDGIAVFGRTITDEQAFWLNRPPRQKIIVPDRDGAGFELAKRGIELGWSVATPDLGGSKDVNAAISKYGKMFVRQSISNSISDGMAGLLKAKLYCGVK